MGTIQTINMSLEKNTKLQVEHTDRNGVVHRFKVWRIADGKWCKDEGWDHAFMDLYQFEPEGNKPTFKLRLKLANEEKSAWFSAGWPPKEGAPQKQTPTPAEDFPSDDDSFGDW
jgi:hypothetical protein